MISLCMAIRISFMLTLARVLIRQTASSSRQIRMPPRELFREIRTIDIASVRVTTLASLILNWGLLLGMLGVN